MTHLTWSSDKSPVELEADYVVVGTGAGGALAAVTLARAGYEVAMVEAGPARRSGGVHFTSHGGCFVWCPVRLFRAVSARASPPETKGTKGNLPPERLQSANGPHQRWKAGSRSESQGHEKWKAGSLKTMNITV